MISDLLNELSDDEVATELRDARRDEPSMLKIARIYGELAGFSAGMQELLSPRARDHHVNAAKAETIRAMFRYLAGWEQPASIVPTGIGSIYPKHSRILWAEFNAAYDAERMRVLHP